MEDVAQLKQKSVQGAISYFGRTLILQAIGLISVFALSAFFSPEDFGIYGFVIQIIGILVFFSDIGLAAALIQKSKEPSEREYALVFTVQQILSWLIVAISVVLVFSGVVARTTGDVGNWVLLSLAISFPLATLKTIPSVKLERKLLFNKLVIPQIAEQLIFHAVLLYFAWKGLGALSYAYAVVSRSIVGVIVMLYLVPWKPTFLLDKALVKSLLSYGALFQTNDLLARIKDQLFYAALGAYLPLQSYGFVQWAKTWSMYPYNLTVQNVMAITFPTFSRLQDRPDLLRKAIEVSLFFITLAIFPILVGMSVFVHPFVDLTPAYAKWEPALTSLVFFTASIGWSAISTPLTNTLNATGHITKTLKLMVLWTTLTWIATPIAVWIWGYTGVSIAAFVISCTSILSVWYAQSVIRFSFWNQVWRQLVASGVMAAFSIFGLAVWGQSYTHLLLGMILAALVYVSSFLVIGRKQLFDRVRLVLVQSGQKA